MKKIVQCLVVVVWIISLAGCGNSVMAANSTAAGNWRLTISSYDRVDSYTMELGENNKGFIFIQTKLDNKEINQYLPLTWTNTTITVNDNTISYTLKNDTLTLDQDDDTHAFVRDGDNETRIGLKPGEYSLVRAIMNGEDRTEEIINTTITVNKDGTGMSRNGDYSAVFTWDEYFFTFETDGNQYFYTFDGKILDEYKGSTHLTFSLKE